RRPGDLWPRLPGMARFIRIVLSIFTIALPTAVLLRGPLADEWWFDVIEVVLIVGTGVATIGALVWAQRRQLSWEERVRVLFGPTSPSSAWESPRIATLLAAGDVGVRDPIQDSPGDHVRAIAELVAILPRGAAAAAGRSVSI